MEQIASEYINLCHEIFNRSRSIISVSKSIFLSVIDRFKNNSCPKLKPCGTAEAAFRFKPFIQYSLVFRLQKIIKSNNIDNETQKD